MAGEGMPVAAGASLGRAVEQEAPRERRKGFAGVPSPGPPEESNSLPPCVSEFSLSHLPNPHAAAWTAARGRSGGSRRVANSSCPSGETGRVGLRFPL